jgi:aryl-alcohol dehydrogenase-like predicted oxidoreductase
MLTGQYKSPDDFEANDSRRHFPRFSKENFAKNLQLVDKKNCTPGQLTLAWIFAQGPEFIVIPGTTKIKNLKEIPGAAKVKLTKEESDQIRKACENADTAGDRYMKEHSTNLYGDSAPMKT